MPPTLGETTRILPACPVCGEVGQPEQEMLRAKIENAPTSEIEDRDPEAETRTFAALPDEPVPELAGFELLEQIGRGGMGVVYRALDKRRQTIVAVKMLPRIDPGALLRFKREFRAISGLNHPNLASVYELGTANGFFFLVMEYISGTPFTEHFLAIRDMDQRLKQLPAALAQLVAGLQHLHENGFVHCDVKPGNVMITADGRVVLLDFGLVTALDRDGSSSGELVGSIGYIAPERYQGHAATPASDWYALGIMLFEVLTGRRPFAGERTRLIWQHQYFDPPSPGEFARDIPPVWNDLCHSLIQRDPLLRPDAAEVLARLGLEQKAERGRTREPPLLGRERQFAVLREAFEKSVRGQTVVVHVRGRSGMGKTALIERFLERLRRREPAWIFHGRCYENESVPFKGVDEFIDAIVQALSSLPEEELEPLLPAEMATMARCFPVLRRIKLASRGWKTTDISNPAELRRKVVVILAELLRGFARQRPVIVSIDDVQWSDPDSSEILGGLVGQAPPVPLLLILSSRTEDSGSPCLELLQESTPAASAGIHRRDIELEPLSQLEAESLVQVLLAGSPDSNPDWETRIAAESQGWPVLIHLFCKHIQESPQFHTPGNGPIDLTLRQIVAERLLGLSPGQRRLLEVLAVAGQPLPEAVAWKAADLSPADARILPPLRRDYWIRSQSHGSRFAIECAHATIRDSILALMPSSLGQELHERLARAYAAEPAVEPEVLAVHLLAAGRIDEAVDLYEQAAERAEEKLAFDRAACLLRLSLDLKVRSLEAVESIRLRLAEALVNAGRGAEAAEVFLRLSSDANRSRSIMMRRLAAYHYSTSGHMPQGLALLREVLASSGVPAPASPERLKAALAWERLRQRWRGLQFHARAIETVSAEDLERVDLCWAATAGTSLFDIVAGAFYQCLHLRHAWTLGEPARVVRALAWEAGHLSTEGPVQFVKAERLLADARSLSVVHEQPYLQALIALVDGILAHNAGQWQQARSYLLQAEDLFRCRCQGTAWERATAHAFLFWSLYQLGAYAEMRLWQHRLMREAKERGDLFAASNFGTFAAPLLCVLDDRADEAIRTVHHHLVDWTEPGFHLQHLTALWSECRALLYRGDAERGYQLLKEALPKIRKAELLRVQTIRITLAALRACLLAANPATRSKPERLRELHETERELIEYEKLPWAEAYGYIARAATARLQDNSERAGDALAAALVRFEKLGMSTHLAATQWWLGHSKRDPTLIAESDRRLRDAGVVHPANFCRMQIGAAPEG